MVMVRILLAILLTVMWTGGAWGATYYATPGGGAAASCLDAGANVCNINRALTVATGAGDIINLAAGTYLYVDGTELDYKNIGANNLTLQGAGRDTTIIDFQNLGDSSGWLMANTKTGFVIKDFTVQNVGNSAWQSGADVSVTDVIGVAGASSGTIQNIRFKDIVKAAIYITGAVGQGLVTIRNCIFEGIKTTTNVIGGYSVVVEASSAATNVNLINNIFKPSATWWGGGVWLHGTPAASRTVNFYNNEWWGQQYYAVNVGGANYIGDMKNNVFIGHGITSNSGGTKAVEGTPTGYATTVNNNINYGSAESPAFYDSLITAGSRDLIGNVDVGITSLPNHGYVILTFDDAAGFNTDAFNNYKAIVEGHGWHMSLVANVGAWDSRHGGTTPTGATATALTAFRTGGHDIAIHSHSHTDVSVLTPAIKIIKSGGDKTVTIATNTDNAGAPDWGTIVKDYTTWTGTLVLDAAGINQTINLIDGSGYFKTLAQVKAEIDAIGGGWSATVDASATGKVSSAAFAISLVEGNYTATTSPGVTVAVSQDAYLWLETKYAKDRLEAIVATVTGSPYTVKSWGSPYHISSARAMDALYEAGYLVGRGKAALTTVGSGWDMRNLARYNIDNWSSDPVTGADATAVEAATSYKFATFAGIGTVYTHTMHSTNIDDPAELAAYTSVFAKLKLMEGRGVYIKSLAEFGDYASNVTNCPVFGTPTVGQEGSTERKHCTNTDLFDGKPVVNTVTGAVSSLIHAGDPTACALMKAATGSIDAYGQTGIPDLCAMGAVCWGDGTACYQKGIVVK
jgi:hypothetical protein